MHKTCNVQPWESSGKQSYSTIWSLAAKNNPDNIDIRKLVYNIREENNLKSANIYPGQQLNIPID